jgi:hypothetical protein
MRNPSKRAHLRAPIAHDDDVGDEGGEYPQREEYAGGGRQEQRAGVGFALGYGRGGRGERTKGDCPYGILADVNMLPINPGRVRGLKLEEYSAGCYTAGEAN